MGKRKNTAAVAPVAPVQSEVTVAEVEQALSELPTVSMGFEKTEQSFVTVQKLSDAIAHANGQYKARKGSSANLGKTGYNPDLAKAHKIVTGLTEGQLKEIAELNISDALLAGLKDASNTKKPMRTMQAVLFTITGSGSFLKGSAKTFLLEFCGLVIAGAKTRQGMKFCATGKGYQGDSDEVYSTAKARKLVAMFSAVSSASESTQNSVSFSKGGIAETLGVAKKDSRTGLPVVNLENKVTQKLNSIIEKMSDSSMTLLVAQASQRESNG